MRALAIAALAASLVLCPALAGADPEPASAPRDDGPAAETTARAPARRADHATLQLALGAGSETGAASALGELRAGYVRPGIAIELAARVRWQRGALVRADWDGVGDWLGLVDRLELAHEDGGVAGALAGGRLAPVTFGVLVDGHSTAALLDRHAPGVTGGFRAAGFIADALVDDLTDPSLVAGAGELAIAGAWRVTAGVALDPGVDHGMTAVRGDGQLEIGLRRRAAWLAASAHVITGVHGDVAAVALGEVDVRRGRLRAWGRLDARAYNGAGAAAPFGPLAPVERERMAPASDAGVASGISGAVAVDGLGEFAASARTRGARGHLVTARFALPWWRAVQAAAYAAHAPDAAIAAAEARIAWTSRWFSALEAGRGYRRADDGALVGLWQATAWFGAAAGW
jgi:hypothetical protein